MSATARGTCTRAYWRCTKDYMSAYFMLYVHLDAKCGRPSSRSRRALTMVHCIGDQLPAATGALTGAGALVGGELEACVTGARVARHGVDALVRAAVSVLLTLVDVTAADAVVRQLVA